MIFPLLSEQYINLPFVLHTKLLAQVKRGRRRKKEVDEEEKTVKNDEKNKKRKMTEIEKCKITGAQSV